ncbi:ABC transporter ATP-binding protein [Pseudonocardia lutea]|uniref:ABC transporter ATP-binding protein n=1 Tax=Pseudonocardia lutea TaxID=2172015 RepID=A0ABW1I9R9_9PSEU
MLRAEGITVDFGGVRAVDDVGLSLAAGEVKGLVGPNGSGKTTLLNAVCGVVRARGTLTVAGEPVPLGRPHAVQRAGIARVFQAPQILEELSVLENIALGSPDRRGAGLPGAWLLRRRMVRAERDRWRAAEEALGTVGLERVGDAEAGVLSYGQRRLVELARALVTRPQVLLLDEPSAGLNDVETEALTALLVRVRETVPAIAVVDHKIRFLDALCDRLLVLENGRAVAEGTPDAVWSDERVVRAYLGRADARDH